MHRDLRRRPARRAGPDRGRRRQVRSLHEGIDDDQVVYHVLLPLEDAAARIEAAMGSLAAGEVLASPAMAMSDVDLEAVRRDCKERSDARPRRTRRGARGRRRRPPRQGGRPSRPIDALAAEVRRVDGREAIILTRSARGRRVLPRRLDLPGPPQDRRPGAAPARARELRRAGRRRRGRHRALSRPRYLDHGQRPWVWPPAPTADRRGVQRAGRTDQRQDPEA